MNGKRIVSSFDNNDIYHAYMQSKTPNYVPHHELKVIRGTGKSNVFPFPKLRILSSNDLREKRLKQESEERKTVLAEVDKQIADVDKKLSQLGLRYL